MLSMRTANKAWLAIPLTVAIAAPARAQDANAIMKKSTSAYAGAKSYEGIYEMDMAMGSMGTVSLTVAVKRLGTTKSSSKTTANGTPSGTMSAGAAMMNVQIIDDGKTMWTYMPGMNKYMKRPHVAGATGVGMMGMMGDPAQAAGTYKLLPSTTIDGKPVFALQLTGLGGAKVNAQASAYLKNAKVTVYVDKATYRFRQMSMTMAQPAGMPGQPGQSASMTMTMKLKSEKFNTPIPESYFKFSPPPGATELKGVPGMGGGSGGLPGFGR